MLPLVILLVTDSLCCSPMWWVLGPGMLTWHRSVLSHPQDFLPTLGFLPLGEGVSIGSR